MTDKESFTLYRRAVSFSLVDDGGYRKPGYAKDPDKYLEILRKKSRMVLDIWKATIIEKKGLVGLKEVKYIEQLATLAFAAPMPVAFGMQLSFRAKAAVPVTGAV